MTSQEERNGVRSPIVRFGSEADMRNLNLS